MQIDIQKLQSLLDQAVASGEESACQLAIYHAGELVADLCAGENIKSDSLFPVFSVGKGLTSVLAHLLYQEGKLDFDAPVSEYWPEFKCCGKENIKVWHIFSHRAGLWELPELENIEQRADWQLMTRLMQEASPVGEPGGKCRYHAATFAWLAGEVISRAGKKEFSELFRTRISEVLKIEREWFFGTDSEAETRLVLPEPARAEDFHDMRYITSCNPVLRAGCIPSSNGIGSARAIAKVYAALSGCGVDGIRLLDDRTLQQATASCRAADDPLPSDLGAWAHFGLGFVLAGNPENPGAIFGHGGAMGAEGFAVPELELAIGFTKNKFNPAHPVHPLRNRISAALGLKIRNW